MSNRGDTAVQRRRLIGALAIVAAIVLAAPVSAAVLPGTERETGFPETPDALRMGDVLEGAGVDGALAAIESIAEADADEAGALPESFGEEVGVLSGARDIRASGSVVGYVVDEPCEEALDALIAHMERRGWAGVDLGGVDGATFLKAGGRYTWALATCTQVGSATSVVIRFA